MIMISAVSAGMGYSPSQQPLATVQISKMGVCAWNKFSMQTIFKNEIVITES